MTQRSARPSLAPEARLDLDVAHAAYVRLVHAMSLLLAGERAQCIMEATHAANAAERSGLPRIARLARACVAICDDDDGDELDMAARAVVRVRIRCFGAFEISLDGQSLTLAGAKPRVRQLLRRLAVSAGVAVHREVLMEALWPEASPQAATRSLHAAISMLRRALEDAGVPATVVRDGQAYRLDRAMADLRRGDATIDAARRALDLYRGELLSEDGPADWVVDAREQRRAEACDAAEALAHALLELGDVRGAVRACERGLRADRSCDALWRLLVAAYVHAGDHAAAARAQREYDAIVRAFTLSAA
jgi:DNA-binding SARP family transcriptional activator